VYLDHRGCWYIRWTEGGRTKQRSTGTADIESAQEVYADFLRVRARGRRQGPRDPAGLPIAEALALYGEEHAPETAAPERIAYAIDALLTFFSENTVAHVSKETCRAYGRARGKSDGTIRRELTVLRAALNYAVGEGRLTYAPVVHLPPPPAPRTRWLTRAEAAALLRQARRVKRSRLYLPLFVLIGLYTGARKESILSLRWPQVDLERGRIDFNQPGRKRTKKGRPIIPIPRRLITFLRLARQRGGELGYVVNRHGVPIHDIKKAFARAAIDAGFRRQDGTDGKDKPIWRATISPHVLRHTAGTWMAQRAVPLWEIGGYLGHGHERTTELYGHHHPDHLAKARRAFD